jgi:hypothetical protein
MVNKGGLASRYNVARASLKIVGITMSPARASGISGASPEPVSEYLRQVVGSHGNC